MMPGFPAQGDDQASPELPRLRQAKLSDYTAIHALESAYLPNSVSETQWCGFFLDNPLWPRLGDRWPIGWVLETAQDGIVGSFLNIPSLYRLRGRDLICANGRAWVVDPRFRFYALWLIEEYYNQDGVDLFINTTIAADVQWVSENYASRVPAGDWETLSFRPARYQPFAAKALEIRHVPARSLLARPAAAALWLRDNVLNRIPAGPPGIDIEQNDTFDERFDGLWSEIVAAEPDTLLAERDSHTLNWHYSIPSLRGELRIFTATRGGRLRAFCVLKRHHRDLGIRSMRLVDFQTAEPKNDLLSPLIRAAIRQCAKESIHVIEHLGRGVAGNDAFDAAAARYHVPHNWSFYYRARDPELASVLSDAKVWRPTEYDGDASYA